MRCCLDDSEGQVGPTASVAGASPAARVPSTGGIGQHGGGASPTSFLRVIPVGSTLQAVTQKH